MFIYSFSIRGGSIIDIYGVPSRFMRSCVPLMEIHYLTTTTPIAIGGWKCATTRQWINHSNRTANKLSVGCSAYCSRHVKLMFLCLILPFLWTRGIIKMSLIGTIPLWSNPSSLVNHYNSSYLRLLNLIINSPVAVPSSQEVIEFFGLFPRGQLNWVSAN